MNVKTKSLVSILLIIIIFVNCIGVFSIPNTTEAFVQKYEYSEYNAPGFFSGIWHGLLAPYSLIARWFMDDGAMYAIPNTGWFYDAGFLIGIVGSIPIGWIAAIISTIGHIIS